MSLTARVAVVIVAFVGVAAAWWAMSGVDTGPDVAERPLPRVPEPRALPPTPPAAAARPAPARPVVDPITPRPVVVKTPQDVIGLQTSRKVAPSTELSRSAKQSAERRVDLYERMFYAARTQIPPDDPVHDDVSDVLDDAIDDMRAVAEGMTGEQPFSEVVQRMSAIRDAAAAEIGDLVSEDEAAAISRRMGVPTAGSPWQAVKEAR